ncbi:hypothetical protein EKO27_g6534 [Xylaria grammica]|uniref:Uncharacterized protein n=1 Tax=Xylaria grammica TaxID=363999 RepID=A0A439D2F1_9PEZI|nr:hypothetical protein EKO27_g6534 [Xylaria grammica]
MASTNSRATAVSNNELAGQRLPATPLGTTIDGRIAQAQHVSVPEDYHEGNEDEHPSDTTASQTSQNDPNLNPTRRLGILESIGGYGLLVIIGGAIVSIASLAFLIFLWTGRGSSPSAIHASPVWRAIILGEWIAQATTLTALVIRSVVAAQAAVCTALLASLLLERHHVPKSDVAQLSVLRAINDGPLKLTWLVLRSFSRLICIETALVFSLAIGSLALQFASTILFSDLHELTIAANVAPFPVNDYIPQNLTSLYDTYTIANPPTYAVFGELPHNASSAPDAKGFSATGRRMRTFIPLAEPSNRTSVHTYNGNAVSLFSSVACMRPIIRSSYIGAYTDSISGKGYSYGRVAGSLHYGESLREAHSVPNLCSSDGCLATHFNCSIPGVVGYRPEWQGSFCVADTVGDSLYDGGGLSKSWDSVTEPLSNYSLVYLFFSTNMHDTDWRMSRNPRPLNSAPEANVGEWNSYEIEPNRFVNVTVCFSSLRIDLRSVKLAATGDLEEPQVNWSVAADADTSQVRKYLGVSEANATFADRGILTIENTEEPERLSPMLSEKTNLTLAEVTTSLIEEVVYAILAAYYWAPEVSFSACTICTFVGIQHHFELSGLIQDTIYDTGRAADALQAYTTVIANSFFHELLKDFHGTEEVHIAFTKTVQAAACQKYGCKGLIAVASLIAFHLVCVALTTGTYARLTKYSRQGNTWHAVSQLTGPQLETTMRKANDMGDDELATEIKEEGNDILMTLRKMEDGHIYVVEQEEETK